MNDTVSALALRESEELHRITLINMSDAVFITNDEGVFTFICPNVDVIFGYGPDEVRAMDRISQLLGKELLEPGQLMANGEIRNIEHEIEAKDGTRRVLLVHVKQVSIKGGTILYACRDVTERRQSEQALRRNEERLTLALEVARAGTWDWHVQSGEMNWSPETHRMFGDTARSRPPSFDAFLDCVNPFDRERVARTMTDAMERAATYETEFRVRGYDRIERWIMGRGKALRNGTPLRMLGVFVDFTERHRVEQELRDLSGRLIGAHEQECIRLSQELHDDIAQRVALLAVELGVLRQRLASAPQDIRQQVATLSARAEDIGSGVHRLSHELHPSRLQHLGLEESIRMCCRDVAEARQISIHVEIAEVPALEADVALCLYRITQEALHNIVKHSGATRVVVTLALGEGEVSLSVVDNGMGFDPATVREKDTLGLVSMRERARHVQGQFWVTSKPDDGTRVEVRVPVRAS